MDGYLSGSVFSDEDESVEEELDKNPSSARDIDRAVVTPHTAFRSAEADFELSNATDRDTPLRPRDSIQVGPTRKRIAHRLLDSSSACVDDSDGDSEIMPTKGEMKELKGMLKLLWKKVEDNSKVLTELQNLYHSRLVYVKEVSAKLLIVFSLFSVKLQVAQPQNKLQRGKELRLLQGLG